MEIRESFPVNQSFPATCQYIQTAFFPKLKQLGAGAMIQLIPPIIAVNEPSRFAMRRILEQRISLTVEAAQDQTGTVLITVMSSFRATFPIINGIIASVLTCGLAALVIAPLFYLKYNRWNADVQKAVALLKTDLGG